MKIDQPAEQGETPAQEQSPAQAQVSNLPPAIPKKAEPYEPDDSDQEYTDGLARQNTPSALVEGNPVIVGEDSAVPMLFDKGYPKLVEDPDFIDNFMNDYANQGMNLSNTLGKLFNIDSMKVSDEDLNILKQVAPPAQGVGGLAAEILTIGGGGLIGGIRMTSGAYRVFKGKGYFELGRELSRGMGKQLLGLAPGVAVAEAAIQEGVKPELDPPVIELMDVFGYTENTSNGLLRMVDYIFRHSPDDASAEKVLKTTISNLGLEKVLGTAIVATGMIIKNWKTGRDSARKIREALPEVKDIIGNSDVSKSSVMKSLIPKVTNDAEVGGVLDNNVLKDLGEKIKLTAKEGQVLQLGLTKKFTERSSYNNEIGFPIFFNFRGKINGELSTWHNGAVGFRTTQFSSKLGGKTGKDLGGKGDEFTTFAANVPAEARLDLTIFGKQSDSVANNPERLIEEIESGKLADNTRFDPVDVIQVKSDAKRLSFDDLVDIARANGVDAEDFDESFLRSNYILERLMDKAGYRTLDYNNATRQGGISTVFIHPETDLMNVFTGKTGGGKIIVTDNFGSRVVNGDEASWIKELSEATKAVEKDFNLNYASSESAKGVDFNIGRIETADDAAKLMDEVSDHFASVMIEAKRGEITHRLTEAMAKDLGMTVEDVLKRQKGGTFNAEQMLASRAILNSSLNSLDQIASKISKGGAENPQQLKLDFVKALSLHSVLQAQVKGAQTEIARAMSAQRIRIGEFDPVSGIDADQLLKSYGNIDDLSKNYLLLKDSADRNKFIRSIQGKGIKAYVYYLLNAMLSAPSSQAVNMAGGVAMQVQNAVEFFPQLAIASGRRLIQGSTDGVRISDATAMLTAMPQGIMEGLALAKKSFVTNVPSTKFNKVDQSLNKAISSESFHLDTQTLWGRSVDYLGIAIGMPTRMMMSTDEAFKGFTSRIHLNVEANRRMYQQAASGAKPEDIAQDYMRTINGANDGAMQHAIDKAHEMTFTSDLGDIGKWLQTGRHKIPLLQIQIPFFRAPVNIVKQGLKRTPLGLLMPSVSGALKKGGAEADTAMARIAAGSGIMWAVSQLAQDGIITGSGTGVQGLDAHMRNIGIQPNSFAFDKTTLNESDIAMARSLGAVMTEDETTLYISYRGVEPFNTIAALAADTANFIQYSRNDLSNEELASAASMYAIQNLTNNTWMSNVYDLANITQDQGGFFKRFVNDFLSKNVPAIVRKGERVGDPEKRIPDIPTEPNPTIEYWQDTIGRLQKTIPGQSEKLPLGKNVWGHVIKYGDGHWWEMANPAHVKKSNEMQIDKEFKELGWTIGYPSDEIQGVKISSQFYSEFLGTYNEVLDEEGLTLRESLSSLVDQPEYNQLTRDEKKALITNVNTKFVKAAKQEYLALNPELQFEVEAKILNDELLKLEAREGVQ